jgi:UDP:flavonoid glycosyltransferase YjiC (YdhE family)
MADEEPMTSTQRRIAFFVSPHGYGHASRASAVMSSIHRLNPTTTFEIFTQVPRWFFEQSLPDPFGYHSVLTDIGMVQETPLAEDVPATVHRLNDFLPFERGLLDRLASKVADLQCDLVLCDIAPMGIAVALHAKIPSVLIENFTWDWIYAGYPAYHRQMAQHIDYLKEVFAAASYHIQTEPVCLPWSADLTTPPVTRNVRSEPAQVRAVLEVPEQAKLALITMGGMRWNRELLTRLENQGETFLVIAANTDATERQGNLIRLARNTEIFHPDLVNACDAIVCKAGYSTLAESYQAGIPVGYIPRPGFRESPIMADFVETHMHGLPVTEAELHDGSWLETLEKLLPLPRFRRDGVNGADQIARFICDLPLG